MLGVQAEVFEMRKKLRFFRFLIDYGRLDPPGWTVHELKAEVRDFKADNIFEMLDANLRHGNNRR